MKEHKSGSKQGKQGTSFDQLEPEQSNDMNSKDQGKDKKGKKWDDQNEKDNQKWSDKDYQKN